MKTNIQSSNTGQKKSFVRFNFLSELFFIVCIQVLVGLQPVYATTTNGLGYFGFAIVDCGWDDPIDATIKTNYIDEVASFTNIAQMCVYSSGDNIGSRIATFNTAGVKAILHIQSILFRPGLSTAPSGGKRMILRSNAAKELTTFVTLNKGVLNPSSVAALFIFDEPVWNGVSRRDLTLALQIVKKALPDIPTMVIEASPAVDNIMIPIELDWVGINDYNIIDPEHDVAWLAHLSKVSTARSRADQKIVIVANTQWLPYFLSDAGISPIDMDATINSYARLAESYPDVVALVGYPWAGGLDDPQQLGARSLPANIQQSFQTIGFEITGK